MGLEGKVAIVTGGSRSIGRAIALALAKAGADIVVAARTETEGEMPGTIHKTAGEVRALGRRALAVKTDVSKEAEVEGMVSQTMAEFGRIDVLVNNAGIIGPTKGVLETTTADWDAIVDVNLRGAFLCARAVAPVMAEQREGAIINISSGAAVRTGFLSIPYGVSKAGLDRLTTGLAGDLGKYNITAISLSAPWTAVDRFGTGKLPAGVQPPEFTARAVVYLLEHGPMKFSGQVVTPTQLREKLGADI